MSMRDEERSAKKQQDEQHRGFGAAAGDGNPVEKTRLDQVRNASLLALASMCEQAKCRRVAILAFFDEVAASGSDVCKGSCDFCKDPEKVRTAISALDDDSGYGAFGGGYTRRYASVPALV